MTRRTKNILFIMCDQLRWDYLSCAGHPRLHTPNIDALAATGAGRIIRRFPCVGGIDLSGTVVESGDARFKKGDEVITSSGIYARVHGVMENIVTLEIADNVRIKMDKQQVATVKTAGAAS